VKHLLGLGWKIFIELMGCGELRDKILSISLTPPFKNKGK